MSQRKDALDLAADIFDPRMIRLIDHKDVGYLHDARFDRLNVITHTGDEDDDGDVRERGNVHLVLPHADRLYQDYVTARCVHQMNQARGGGGETASRSPRRQRAYEYTGVRMMPLHADAIAQNRAA